MADTTAPTPTPTPSADTDTAPAAPKMLKLTLRGSGTTVRVDAALAKTLRSTGVAE